jgi:hypothetical protein
MLIVRQCFQAKYGRGNELVALFKEFNKRMQEAGAPRLRILTDASGPFFTVVTEVEAENFAAWEVQRDDEQPLDGRVVRSDDAAGRVGQPGVLQSCRIAASANPATERQPDSRH